MSMAVTIVKRSIRKNSVGVGRVLTLGAFFPFRSVTFGENADDRIRGIHVCDRDPEKKRTDAVLLASEIQQWNALANQ